MRTSETVTIKKAEKWSIGQLREREREGTNNWLVLLLLRLQLDCYYNNEEHQDYSAKLEGQLGKEMKWKIIATAVNEWVRNEIMTHTHTHTLARFRVQWERELSFCASGLNELRAVAKGSSKERERPRAKESSSIREWQRHCCKWHCCRSAQNVQQQQQQYSNEHLLLLLIAANQLPNLSSLLEKVLLLLPLLHQLSRVKVLLKKYTTQC